MIAALRHDATQASFARAVSSHPAERLLSGHSGARVVLCSDGRDSFVRKSATDPAASARLAAQADKQHGFWMFGLPFPKVRAQTMGADGLASFDMNYIPGRTLADAVTNGGVYDSALAVKAVERLVRLFALSAGMALPPACFTDKIDAVASQMAEREDDPARLDAIRDCARRLGARDWRDIPETPCHGDLTLENILLTAGGSIAFIDCDTPFASSYWLDFGKLFQDIAGHWCLRALYVPETGGVRLLNAIQKLDGLAPRFHDLAAQFDVRLPARLPQLAALGLLRALPYTQNPAVRTFLCRRMLHLLED